MFLLFGGRWSSAERNILDALLGIAASTTECSESAVRELAARYRFADRLLAIGRGFSYVTARECALKVMETSYLSTHAFSTAELLHGPLAMVDRDTPIIAVTGGNRVSAEGVLARLRELGADVLVVGGPELSMPTERVPDTLLPVLDILPLQRLAWHMALARGVDPDQPRNLAKVTSTT